MATPEDIARLERIYENDQVVIEGPNLYVEEAEDFNLSTAAYGRS